MKQMFFILLLLLGQQQANAQYWEKVNSGTERQLLSIAFVNQQVGYIGGANGLLLKTMNGGETWDSIPSPDLHHLFNASDIIDLQFVTANMGYLITSQYGAPIYQGTLWKTTDAGLHWTQAEAGVVAAYRSHFFSDGNGFIIGSAFFAGHVISKLEGGNAAAYHYFASDAAPFLKTMDFRNAQVGIVAGDYGLIARTFNGGISWDTLTCQATDTTINSIKFLNDSIIIASCEAQGGTILISFDTGRTWQTDLNSLTFDYPILQSIAVSKKDSFIAVGASTTFQGKGTIYRHNIESPNMETIAHPLKAVAMLNDSVAYAVGDSGIIVTNKKSNPVSIHTPGLSENDFKVFPNPTTGYFRVTSNLRHVISIFDITGKLVFEDHKETKNRTISLKHNVPGLYVLQIKVGDKKCSKRLEIIR
jgi:photosystem II stability/assembly factor-like uncharacterized protein